MSKSMTCTQLGGPCDVALRGEALAAMKAGWRRPVSGLEWYRDVQRSFASLPHKA